MIAGFSHVNLRVNDYEMAMAFYRDLLGFTELPRPDFGRGPNSGAWLRVGDLQLHLSCTTSPLPDAKGAHVAFHVPRAEFDSLVETLAAADVTFEIGPVERVDFGTSVIAVFVKDPFGNYLEFTDVGPLS
ncbi:MAG: glyoxalase superfamily protein [Acidimicrobiia bacterium]